MIIFFAGWRFESVSQPIKCEYAVTISVLHSRSTILTMQNIFNASAVDPLVLGDGNRMSDVNNSPPKAAKHDAHLRGTIRCTTRLRNTHCDPLLLSSFLRNVQRKHRRGYPTFTCPNPTFFARNLRIPVALDVFHIFALFLSKSSADDSRMRCSV